MAIKKITTKKQYNATLRRMEEIFQAQPDTPEAKEAERLEKIISEYEDEHFPIPTSRKKDMEEYRKLNRGEKSFQPIDVDPTEQKFTTNGKENKK